MHAVNFHRIDRQLYATATALVMEQTGPTNDPFKGFHFPRGTTPLQCHLYAGAKNICSGAYLHRKAAIQLIWQNADITWHPWIDRALKSFCDYNWVTWTGPAASRYCQELCIEDGAHPC